ncbi:MAG: MurR/RpiR family transcriptional regulator [Lachnospiraceae bacterium]|nr:MurR/RpiR family transcriptional regulator [Lachnospiraceae bacterium]
MILVPIVERYSTFTEKEQQIADYILNNPEQALTKTASELAVLTSTSPAAIVRFSRKIGFDSFPSMKVGLAKYFNNNQYFERDMIINADDSYENCANKLLAQITDVCTTTANHIDYAILAQVVHMIDHAGCIYLLGVGSSANVAQDMQQKLLRINKKAFFLPDSQINLLSTITISREDVVLAFSFSGTTNVITVSAQAAKKQGAFLVAITGNPDSPVGRTADICLSTPAIERKTRIGAVSSRYSQQYICDLLFLCLVSKHYDEAEELTMYASNLLSHIL